MVKMEGKKSVLNSSNSVSGRLENEFSEKVTVDEKRVGKRMCLHRQQRNSRKGKENEAACVHTVDFD